MEISGGAGCPNVPAAFSSYSFLSYLAAAFFAILSAYNYSCSAMVIPALALAFASTGFCGALGAAEGGPLGLGGPGILPRGGPLPLPGGAGSGPLPGRAGGGSFLSGALTSSLTF